MGLSDPRSSAAADRGGRPGAPTLSADRRLPVAAAVIAGEGVFTARIVAGWADVAAAIARLVAVEVVKRFSAAFGQRSAIAVMRIEAVVDMAVEVAGAAEPVTSANKHSVHKPIGPVVAVGRALIRRIVEVPIGTDRFRSKVDADGDLGRCGRHPKEQAHCEGCESEDSNFGHDLSLIGLKCGMGWGLHGKTVVSGWWLVISG